MESTGENTLDNDKAAFDNDKNAIPAERPDILESRKATSRMVLEIVEYLEQNYYSQLWRPRKAQQYSYGMTSESYRLGNDQALPDTAWAAARDFMLQKCREHGFTEVIFEISDPGNHDISVVNPAYDDEFSFGSQVASYISLKLEDRPGLRGGVLWPEGTGLPDRLLAPEYRTTSG